MSTVGPGWHRTWDTADPCSDVDIMPIADDFDHDLGGDCACGPAAELIQTAAGDVWMYSHASLDGREAHE